MSVCVHLCVCVYMCLLCVCVRNMERYHIPTKPQTERQVWDMLTKI